MKISAATSPTNKAAIASIVSMMRSITLRFTPTSGSAARPSEPRAVLLDAVLELLPDLVGVAAGLGDRVGPLLLQRCGGGLPGLQLVGGERIDLVTRQSLHLRQACRLEIGPWRGELHRPFGRAMVVDHLLLGGRHGVVLGLVDRVGEDRGVERHIHVVL